MRAIPGLTPSAPSAGGQAPAAAPRPAAAASEVHTPSAAEPTPEELRKTVEALRKALAPVARDLRFSIDQETGKTVITVTDVATREVIRQIPSQEALDIAHALDRLQGVLLKQKA